MSFQSFPAAGVAIPDTSKTFTLTTTAPTDIWRKPPTHDVFNAPLLYRSLPIRQFRSISVIVSAAWATLYDQGGLVLVVDPVPPHRLTPERWVKAGIEFYEGKPCVSVVFADKWADWSLSPVPAGAVGEAAHGTKLEVKMERVHEEDSKSLLRISVKGPEGKWTPIREVTWFFEGEKEDEVAWCGVYTAKPTVGDDKELNVQFEGLEVVTTAN
jgi:regulation of enolase protein 1 (concanavalin A-like superfamily)